MRFGSYGNWVNSPVAICRMTDSGIVPYVPAGPPALLAVPWYPSTWGYVALLTLLLASWGIVAWCLCCSATETAPKQQHLKQKGASSAYSGTLPMSRYPKEGVSLATFITRRDQVWRDHHLRGGDCWLVLD